VTQGRFDVSLGVTLDPAAPRGERMGSVEGALWTSLPTVGPCEWDDDGWVGTHGTLPTLVGVDEAGRGPLAGPVSVAAVVLSPAFLENPPDWLSRLDDSKRLNEQSRAELFPLIQAQSEAWSIAHLHAEQIDRVNILRATFQGMSICVEAALGLPLSALAEGPSVVRSTGGGAPNWYADALGEAALRGAHLRTSCPRPRGSGRGVAILVDGNKRFKAPGSRAADLTQHPIVKGDGLSYHIAAASILAKVSRDAVMEDLGALFPAYGFARHKGYPTAAHRAAVKECGACVHHRNSFKIT
jgi:ribonuclease HII